MCMVNKAAWWDSSIGYIVFPASFKDSDGDGIGDINGLASRLPYLHDLGVSLLWLCPVFDSPMRDAGYDVRDYLKVNPAFGTMDDFEGMLKTAHSLGIKVILDFPLNHTSDEHPWFRKALSDPSSKERGYYYFRKGRWDGGRLLPPNNWKGFFSTSAWERVGDTDEFYLHLFTKGQPDVNWSNEALRDEFAAIARFWLDKGVDGFRLDAIAHLAKDLSFRDAPGEPNKDGLVLNTSMFSNRPELIDYLRDFKKKAFAGRDCLLVGEFGGEIQPLEALSYVRKRDGVIDMCFNFDTVWENGALDSFGKPDSSLRTDVISLKNNFMRWYGPLHEKASMPVYWCNHDHPRVMSQYGSLKHRNESAKMLLTTLLFLYGTPFIYQGDEIGMVNPPYESVKDYEIDLAEALEIKEWRAAGRSEEDILRYLQRTSRVNARSPMQWDKGKNAGFSEKEPTLKPNPDYLNGINVQSEMEDPWSILNFYQYAIAKRREPLISESVLYGPLEIVDFPHPDVFAYRHRGAKDLMVISNFRDYETKFSFYFEIGDILLHNYDGVELSDHVFTLRPFESYLLEIR